MQPHSPHSALPPPLGGAFIGPYRVLGALGAGGVGQVLRVQDEIGRELALKLLGNPGSKSKEARFAREGEVTASLTHPGIVRVHGWGTSHAGPYLVYELIEGEDLESCFEHLSRDVLLDLLVQVADALGYAHAKGVVHRDVKPANVLVGAGQRAWLADFGMAQAAGLERLTLSGALVGTPHYMSPEQAVGERERFGPPTDVWALGVLLYRVLTGRDPFAGSSMIMLLAQVTSEQPEDPGKLPGVSIGLAEVCMRALEKDPANRYSDGAAFAADLRRAIGGESVIGRKSLRAHSRWYGTLGWVLGSIGMLAGVAAGVHQLGLLRADPAPVSSRPTAVVDPKLDVQREQLAEVLALLGRGESEVARAPLDQLRITALGDPERERLLWTEGVAAVARVTNSTDFEHHLPLLRMLTRLPTAARGDPGGDAERVTELGVLLAADYLTRGNAARTQGDTDQDASLTEDSRELLQFLADCGWRLSARGPGEEILNQLLVRWRVEAIPEASYWWFLLAALRLDFEIFPYGTFMDPRGRTPSLERRWPWSESSRDPWKRFFELRMEIEATGKRNREALRDCLFEPANFGGEGWSLGPRQWASAATCLASTQPEAKAFELLRAAIESSDQSPEAYRDMSIRLAQAGKAKEALVPSSLALERFETAYVRDIGRRPAYKVILRTQTEILCTLGKREEARPVYVRLRGVDLGDSQRLRARFPWLESD